MLPLLPIELENKLKERTQMFRKRLKIWDPKSRLFFRQHLEDNVVLKECGRVTPMVRICVIVYYV